jgi:alkanesulfonate monooxygenase SsuD/methylene tetrahydromethanopterin reductase-like flavin-dependent oxidoreductase (luciferase family)
MIEDICMLDQMSGGRLEIGFGRGSVPAELIYYGQSPEQAQAIYTEALELILKGLTERTLTFHGQFFRFDNVPMELEPLQKPHPPIWYGVHAPESAERAARKGLRVVSLDPVVATCAAFDRFRATWREARGEAPLPLMGLGRFIVVAETDAAALAAARRAYPVWHRASASAPAAWAAQRPSAPAELRWARRGGPGRAGAPETVAAFLRAQLGNRQQLLRGTVRLRRPHARRDHARSNCSPAT